MRAADPIDQTTPMNRTLFQYSFVAALGGLLFGFDTAVINGALPFLRDHFQWSEAIEGWAVSSALLGCIVGAILIGRPGDLYGRRAMLKVLAWLFLISALGSAWAPSVTWFVVFRLIGGVAVGGSSVLAPMYVSEISPPEYRGRFTITFQLAIVLGILVAFFSDYLLLDTGPNNWRWMFLAEAVPAVAFIGLLFFVSESPRWLVKNGEMEAARLVLQRVNPGAELDRLLPEIQASINTDVIDHIKYLFRKPYLRLVLIGIAVGMFNQFTGINIVMYYASDIFRAAGFSTQSAIGQTVLIGFTNLVVTILAMVVIDRFGRKRMLLTGALGMTVFLALFGYAFLARIEGFVLLACLIGFTAFFAFSQGAVIWVLLSEMFPNNIRARGSSIGSFSHWFFNGLTVFLFPIISRGMTDGSGIGYIFLFYAVATLVSFFFFKRFLVETKGLSLEELEKRVVG